LITQWTVQQEIEFFKLAGFMLLARFQVSNGYTCVEVEGHATDTSKILYHQSSYVGYKDSIAEMKLLLKEFNPSTSSNG
jgi:hypothetical protein